MQDDTAFRSQEFANQVEERRDRISQTQIGLNLQAGELSNRFIQAQRQEQQFQMEQTMQASQLSRDELVRQQAAAELMWAKELHSVKFLENAQKRDVAATELAVLQAKREKDKLGAVDPDLFTSEDSRLNLQAMGVTGKFNYETNAFEIDKTPASADDRTNAQKQLDQRYQTRYGERSRPGFSPGLEDSRKTRELTDLAKALADEDDPDIKKALLKRFHELGGGGGEGEKSFRSSGGEEPKAPQAEKPATREQVRAAQDRAHLQRVLSDPVAGPIAQSAYDSKDWQESPFWSGIVTTEADRTRMALGIGMYAKGLMQVRENLDPQKAHQFVMDSAQKYPFSMGMLLATTGLSDEEIQMRLDVMFAHLPADVRKRAAESVKTEVARLLGDDQ